MALSVAILVGEAQEWIPDIVSRAQKLKVNAGHEPGTDVGPVITPQAKEKILRLIESGLKEVSELTLSLSSFFPLIHFSLLFLQLCVFVFP